MIKKSDNMTSILALIIGLAALTVAIVSLVNNKKDDFTTTDSSCCVKNCDDKKWCIYEDTNKSLVFKCLDKPKFTIPFDGHTGIVPALGIIAYHGSTVPDGWVICDGNNNTPDLTDRFILGTTSSPASKKSWLYKMPASGGSWTIDLDQMPNHQHNITFPKGGIPSTLMQCTDGWGCDPNQSLTSGTDRNPAGTTDEAGSRHPYIQQYYKLMYIMRERNN